MTEWPTISVVITTYQRPKLLARQLDSLLAQTFKDFEVVVAYDGPADEETVAICKEYIGKFAERDVLMCLAPIGDESSGYYCVPCNHSMGFVRGDYIYWCDDDNETNPASLELMCAAMEEGDVWPDFVYGQREYVIDDDCPKTKNGIELQPGFSPVVPWGEDAVQQIGSSAMNNFLDKADILVSRGAMWMLAKFTGMCWNEGWRRFGDWECYCRGIYFAGWRGKCIEHVVQRYHWTGSNIQLTRPANDMPQGITLDTNARMVPA